MSFEQVDQMSRSLPLPESPDFPSRFRRLTALQQAQALARGKRRHERRYGKPVHGGDRQSESFRALRKQEDRRPAYSRPDRCSFTNFAAWRLGCTARSIQIGVRIAERIPTALQAALAETDIGDRKNDLVRISAMSPQQHARLLRRFKDGPEALTLDEALRTPSGTEAA